MILSNSFFKVVLTCILLNTDDFPKGRFLLPWRSKSRQLITEDVLKGYCYWPCFRYWKHKWWWLLGWSQYTRVYMGGTANFLWLVAPVCVTNTQLSWSVVRLILVHNSWKSLKVWLIPSASQTHVTTSCTSCNLKNGYSFHWERKFL